MKIYAIIRAKMNIDSRDEFFSVYDRRDMLGTVDTLYTGRWSEAEVCMVTKRDKKLEKKICDCEIGSMEERRLLRKYYKKQE